MAEPNDTPFPQAASSSRATVHWTQPRAGSVDTSGARRGSGNALGDPPDCTRKAAGTTRQRVEFRVIPRHRNGLTNKCVPNRVPLGRPRTNGRSAVSQSRQRKRQVDADRFSVSRCPRSAVAQWPPVVGQPSADRVTAYVRNRFRHQVRQRGQCDKLARGEIVGERLESVTSSLGVACPGSTTRCVRLPARLRASRDRFRFRRWREVDTRSISGGDDGHQAFLHSARVRLFVDVVVWDGNVREQASKCPGRQPGAAPGCTSLCRLTCLHREPIAARLDDGLDVCLPASPGGEHEGGHERHIHVCERRVRALHRARPNPCDDSETPSLVRLQVGPLSYDLRGDLDVRIEVSYPPFGLVAHPVAIVASVLGQPLRATPLSGNDRPVFRGGRVHGRLMGESRRDLEHRLADQHGHWIQIAGIGVEPEPLCFEG